MKADISRLGELSKIKFDEAELKKMGGDMESIMALMDSLLAVEPVDFEGGDEYAALDSLREDEVKESFDPALLVSQSKDAADDCFVIPKVL
ncbi:MAG: aspartyl/glutamyl-tRNA amidotransferase subunit C [Clostridiales bacterium]|jgi:aspartyl/glutamyl-tRNA(Asn/Gln) amidotransferase C subunit|nr:aspartyl/glutamyl-tRNA amidotransferase subunit C [Clostridiales bacterium]